MKQSISSPVFCANDVSETGLSCNIVKNEKLLTKLQADVPSENVPS